MAKPTSSQGTQNRGTTSGTRRTTVVRKPKESVKTIAFGFPWTRVNALLLVLGLATLVVGYLLMATSVGKDAQWDNSLAVTIAPIILVVAYLIIIPYAIMRSSGKTVDDSNS